MRPARPLPLRQIVFLVALMAGFDAGAVEAANESQEGNPPEESASDGAESETSKEAKPDVFVPTEELSEDRPVSFPVDV